MQLPIWWRATALALALLAATLFFATRALVGPRGAVVHVRWQPATETSARQNLETTFRLTERQQLDDHTWRYNLIDPSSNNIRAIVSHPAVEDTHHIDRRSDSLASSAARTARQQRFAVDSDAVVRVADRISLLLTAVAGLLLALGVAGRASTPGAASAFLAGRVRRVPGAAQTAAAPVMRLLSRGIPEINAQTAGMFRIVFGTAVVAFFVSHPESAPGLNATFNPLTQGELHALVLRWLRAHPYVVDSLTPWLLMTGAAFTAGLLTRLTYPLFVAGALIWVFVAVLHDSTHPHSTLALTLVALLPSRWGDALSVDSWRGRRTAKASADKEALPHNPAGKQYGYSVWVPGLVFGVAFAAAAWAKLGRNPGWTDWILNGSVKYHFITDSFNAPVDWGLQLAGHPSLAVLASFGAVGIEVFVITAAFMRSQWYRLSLGAGALALLSGFWLFMGVFWPGWWILLLAFLPWRYLSRWLGPSQTPASGPGVVMQATAIQAGMIAAVLAQQIVVSALAVERAPMFTYYPMYSATYASPAQFDASMVPYYRIMVSTDREKVELPCNAPEDLVEVFRAALAGSADAAADVWRAVRGCGGDRADARSVTFEGELRVFDWDRLRFRTTPAAVVLGPLPAAQSSH